MTFTQAEIDAFRDFMVKNKGVTEMWLADRHYKFASLKEMEDHLGYMERTVAVTANSNRRTRYGATSKGLC